MFYFRCKHLIRHEISNQENCNKLLVTKKLATYRRPEVQRTVGIEFLMFLCPELI
jgi:hypothetical protein